MVLEFKFSGIVFGVEPGLYHIRQLFFFPLSLFYNRGPLSRIKCAGERVEPQENTD